MPEREARLDEIQQLVELMNTQFSRIHNNNPFVREAVGRMRLHLANRIAALQESKP